jgi:uncharacterized protein (DUF305 family)
MLNGTAVALALLLSACGSGGEGTQNEVAASNDMNAMAADPSNPFEQSEMQMNERMMAAVGTDAGDSWAKKMIEHHQGAIDMSRIVLEQNPSADVAMMARETIEKQQKDIGDIRKLLKDGAPNQQSAELYRPAMMQMHEKMMAAKGADVSETFMRKMLEHHKGAVAMSDVALQNGVSGALREQVQKTRDENQKDAKMIEAMLGGQSHEQAMAASGAKSAEQVKAEPAPADKPKAAPAAEPKSASKPATAAPKAAPAAQPKAQPKAPESTCLPEHRAAGHC